MINIRRTLRRLEDMNIMADEHFYQKIKYFPIVLIIWWFVPSVHRLYTMIFGEEIFILAVIHVFCESSYGFVNMLLYALNPKVKRIIVKKIKNMFRKKDISNETSESLTPENINQ